MTRAYDEKGYMQTSLPKLVIVAIRGIVDKHEECAYERIVKECFTLFPKRFSFRRYPEWPDGSRIKIEILRCRNHGWVTGTEKSGFQITSLGKRAAEEVFKELKEPAVKKPESRHRRDRGETVLKYLKETDAFRRFKTGSEGFSLSDNEFRNLLVATFETPPRVLLQKLLYCLDVSGQYNEKELSRFLTECKRQKAHLLRSHEKNKKKPQTRRRKL